MRNLYKEQLVPIVLTAVTFFGLWLLLYWFLTILNLFPAKEHILLHLHLPDILVGLIIYLKTSVDFGIFIGNLMRSNPGWKKRIAIELGTAIGNGLGTLVVLTIWNFFREVPLLMAIMILLASLVLLKMAQESLEEFCKAESDMLEVLNKPIGTLNAILERINKLFSPLLNILVPHVGLTRIKTMPWMQLMFFAFSIPFILGLDDFAGYIPLFSIINVYGFAVGVFLGHMILNIALFLSPKKTVQFVQKPLVLLFGGLAFVGIAIWGFYEVIHLLETIFHF